MGNLLATLASYPSACGKMPKAFFHRHGTFHGLVDLRHPAFGARLLSWALFGRDRLSLGPERLATGERLAGDSVEKPEQRWVPLAEDGCRDFSTLPPA